MLGKSQNEPEKLTLQTKGPLLQNHRTLRPLNTFNNSTAKVRLQAGTDSITRGTKKNGIKTQQTISRWSLNKF